MSDSSPAGDACWAAYYQAHEGRAVSPLLRSAITQIADDQSHRQAVDLGCGAGYETRFLLEAGWDVLAVDKEPLAIERVQSVRAVEYGSNLVAVATSFEELTVLPCSALIHAGLSLPFCRPQSFASLWALILSSLKPGGVFVGHLFGNRDDWSGNADMSFHTAAEVTALLADLNVRYLRELDEDGNSMQGPKHWHRFDIIASKPVGGRNA